MGLQLGRVGGSFGLGFLLNRGQMHVVLEFKAFWGGLVERGGVFAQLQTSSAAGGG